MDFFYDKALFYMFLSNEKEQRYKIWQHKFIKIFMALGTVFIKYKKKIKMVFKKPRKEHSGE
jgi:hypothetical protein